MPPPPPPFIPRHRKRRAWLEKSSADLAAVKQFRASVGEISRQVAVSSELASQAVRCAEASQVTIRGLATSTVRIGDVVGPIDSIAG